MTLPIADSITLRDGASVAVVAPHRGGLVTHFAVGDRPILFLDEATLLDPTKNVRGGVPVLFPSPGKLANDAWRRGADHGALKQHGFARNLPWRVVTGGPDHVTLALASDGTTRAVYPWDFEVEMTIRVRGAALRLEHTITNRGGRAMPFGFGFHPYFAVADADKAAARIPTAAPRAFDNVTKQTVPLTAPIDLARPEVDLHLLGHGDTAATLELAGGRAVRVSGSAEYTHWVVWTLAGRDFVCLEPWTAPGDALNTGDRVIELAPGGQRALWIEIAAR